jgi:hypothetical protein
MENVFMVATFALPLCKPQWIVMFVVLFDKQNKKSFLTRETFQCKSHLFILLIIIFNLNATRKPKHNQPIENE